MATPTTPPNRYNIFTGFDDDDDYINATDKSTTLPTTSHGHTTAISDTGATSHFNAQGAPVRNK